MEHPAAPSWRDRVVDVPDWPAPGVLFKDITPLLADPVALDGVVDALADRWRGEVDVVAGVEARGFLLGTPLALRLGVGFVPLRKQGKLPRATRSAAYALEYGEAVLEVHADAVAPGARVLVVDDVLATGGTAAAALQLVTATGGVAAGLAVLMELTALGGRAAVAAAAPGAPVSALLEW